MLAIRADALTASERDTLFREYVPLTGADAHVGEPTSTTRLVVQFADRATAAWRGFLLPHEDAGRPVFVVDSVAALRREPRMRYAAMHDWQRIGRVLRGEWPRPEPPNFVFTTQTPQLHAWFDGADAAPYVAIDTEYNRDTKAMTWLGLGYPGMPSTLGIDWMHVWEGRRDAVRERVARLVSRVPVVFQNTFADVPVLDTALHVRYAQYARIDDTMLAHAVLWSELPHDLEFLASLYSQHAKAKHLAGVDMARYNAGDVLATIDTWEVLRGQLASDDDVRGIYERQSLALIPIILTRHTRGLRVDVGRAQDASRGLVAEQDAAERLAHAYVGWPLNVGSDDQLAHWLYTVERQPVQRHKDTKRPTINADAIATLAAHQDEPHPLLDARVAYADAQQTRSHYITPALEARDGRWYPQFKIHAQATGRWSTTDPPLAQLPVDLETLIGPDPGDVWLGHDWSQIEPRLLEALCGDEAALADWESDRYEKWTYTIFPGVTKADDTWKAKRKFTKIFILRLHYFGDPRFCGDIPGAKVLGLRGPDLVRAAHRYLAARPALAAWRRRKEAELPRTREARTFLGRRRRLLATDRRALVREGGNHEMQGGVADILNTTLVEVCRALPYATLAWTKHDALWIAVPEARVDAARPVYHAIVTREFDVYGRRVSFPADFKERAYVAAQEAA